MKKGTGNKYKKCTVVGCVNFIYSKNLCKSHYAMMRLRGTTDRLVVIKEDRVCEICGNSFGPVSKKSKQRTCSRKCSGGLRTG
jgi:hypothetical protein